MIRYDALLGVVQDQYKRYRHIQPVDLYKLVYQVNFGAKHILENVKEAKDRFEEEWHSLGKLRQGEALLEQIDPDGIICRLNLRVYRKMGGTIRTLWTIIMASAEAYAPTPLKFRDDGQMLMQMAESRVISADVNSLRDCWYRMETEGFPAAHHSERYSDANEPAYRLVLTQKWIAEQATPKK